jgi:hypothetical protein
MKLSTGCEAHHGTGRHPLQMRVRWRAWIAAAADDEQRF